MKVTHPSLFFESYGSPALPSIVFLHGGGAAGWMWREQVQVLSNRYHCLVPDLPEQGRSTDCGAFSMSYAADLVTELIQSQAKGGTAHVVGLSEGAQVALELISRHPGLVDHAMISSAILRPLPGERFYTEALLRWSYRWFVSPFKNNDWWIKLNMRYAAGVPDAFFPEFKVSFQSLSETGYTNLMLANMNYRLPAGLKQFTRPVLVMVGSKEYKQMKASAKDLLEAFPKACGAIVNLGAKATLAGEHNWALTAPALFTRTLEGFLRGESLPPELLPDIR